MSSMRLMGTCPQCGVDLADDAPKGLCGRCLLSMGLDDPADEERFHDGANCAEARQAHRPVGQTTVGLPVPPELVSIHRDSSGVLGRFGDYELLEEIARGGMGVVYRAWQSGLNRVVALKMLLFGPQAPPETVKRFRAEAVATAALQHPNIVAIHEVGFCEGQHFIAMDYVAGSPLSALINDSPLPGRRAAAYAKTTAEAIHYAHERGVLHRDLKPSNVMIDANDQPRVTDFGLAKRLEGDSELTVTGQVLGSPNYMPPEQARGEQGAVSRRTDVYGLGAILYHLLTGRPPFQADSLARALDLVLHSDPVAPRLLNPGIPVDLETICLKCLEKEPAKRYATAQMLAEELGRFLEGKPVLARPVSRLAKAGRWCRRNPRLASATGVAFLSLWVGLGGATWQWRRAEAEGLIARRNAYAADMKEVQRALQEGEVGRASQLLDAYRPARPALVTRHSPLATDLRGWEWRYFWNRCRSEERYTLWKYSNSVSVVAFSSDGQWLAVRRSDDVVALWDSVAKRPQAELPAQGLRWCRALSFSPRENLLAWGSKDARGTPVVSLWDVDARQEIAVLPHSAAIASVAFSPDAQELAALASDGTVRVWRLESQQVISQFVAATSSTDSGLAPQGLESRRFGNRFTTPTILTGHYGCVRFSPDGRWLAVGEARPQIHLRDRTNGADQLIPVPLPATGITALAFSPTNSQWLAAACGAGDNNIYLWDLATGSRVRLAGHSGGVLDLAFSPDGQTLASTSADQTLRLWDVNGQTLRQRFQGNVDQVWAVAWSPDGKALVTGARDGSVRYWDPTARPAASFSILPEQTQVWGPAFLPDSKTFLTATRPAGAVVRWNTADLQVVERLHFLGTNHTTLDLSRDGRWLALGDALGNVEVWDLPARRLFASLVFPESQAFALIFSPRGSLLACGAWSRDGRTAGKVWAAPGWDEFSLLGVNLKRLFEADFSPDEQTLACGYEDGTAAWWDLATGRRRAFFRSRYSSGVHVAFSPNGKLFATAELDGLMTVWDAATHQSKLIGRSYRDWLHDLVFSPDGRRLIASGTGPEGMVKIWDVETGRNVATLPGEPGWFCHIGFSPDGNTLFAASKEGTTLLWRAPPFEEIETAERTEPRVRQ